MWLSVATTALGVAMLVGFVWAINYIDDHNQSLVSSGGRVAGQVSSLTRDSSLDPGHATVTYAVDARRYSERVDLGSDAANYHLGQQVTVYYDLSQPARMTIDNEDNQPGWSVWLLVILLVGGFIIAGTGLLTMGRWISARRVLRQNDWIPCEATFQMNTNRREVIDLRLADRHLILRSQATGPLRLRGARPKQGLWRDGAIWFTGLRGRHGVIARPGGKPLLYVRAPRTDRTKRRWQRSGYAG